MFRGGGGERAEWTAGRRGWTVVGGWGKRRGLDVLGGRLRGGEREWRRRKEGRRGGGDRWEGGLDRVLEEEGS